ncbi:hypothetical protein PIB30_092126 [Stylosanthes scabra]|uniref:Uncharacterized protein n=1 Tax=Stylosanthes scabra TaxID=79078 RepID=A0ABU6ZTF3_9FABA|nr:hypothetical protein [Stylosanthes scabra]
MEQRRQHSVSFSSNISDLLAPSPAGVDLFFKERRRTAVEEQVPSVSSGLPGSLTTWCVVPLLTDHQVAFGESRTWNHSRLRSTGKGGCGSWVVSFPEVSSLFSPPICQPSVKAGSAGRQKSSTTVLLHLLRSFRNLK